MDRITMDWYYAKDGQRLGPVTAEDLAQLLRSGVITPDSLVWHAGMGDWQTYRTATGMPPVPGATMAPGGFAYAEFGIRFLAYLIDGVIVGLIQAAVVFSLAMPMASERWSWWGLRDIAEIQLTSLAVSLLYFALFWAYSGA